MTLDFKSHSKMASSTQNHLSDDQHCQHTLSNLRKAWFSHIPFMSSKSQTPVTDLPKSSVEVRRNSIDETPFTSTTISSLLAHPESSASQQTVLYLAYGSNLSAETFKGVRGIKPLSSLNVLVPTLELSFDIAGIPYTEPCFANTRIRDPRKFPGTPGMPPLPSDGWYKGLIGVVYEVTKADYATIIATEGGGAGYQDIIVPCFEIPTGTRTVNPFPTTTPFKAHTLFQPALPPGALRLDGARRPDPDYAQASARYLKLITDGAEEHGLPADYLHYLYNLKPYTITSQRQKIGRWIFATFWMPFLLIILGLSKIFANKDGRSPAWLIALHVFIFNGLWTSYDLIFKPIFGDGERTQDTKKESTDITDEKRLLMTNNPLENV